MCKMQPCLQLCLALLFTLIQLLVKSDSTRKSSSRYAGPYRIKFTDFSRCNGSEPLVVDPFMYCNERNKTYNECHHLYGNVTVRRDINKPYPLVITLNQWRDRQWKADGIVMKFPDGLQTLRTHLPDIYHTILKDSWPKKEVYDVNISTHVEFKAIPVFPYGRWKGNLKLLEDKHATSPMFCLNTLLEIVPK